MNDRIKYYQSQLKTYALYYKSKVKALSSKVKIIICLGLVLFVAGLVMFILRDKPEHVATLADASFTYKDSKELKPYSSFFPSIGEDLLLEKMIVNLKQTQEHKSAMGMFVVHLNIAKLDFVQNIKDNEHLIQDVMQRELESFSYKKLSTPQGKKLAKILLKNKANKALGKKMIKRLYFKTFVIQP